MTENRSFDEPAAAPTATPPPSRFRPYRWMAVAVAVGSVALAVQLLAPENVAVFGLYGASAGTFVAMFASVARRKPRGAVAWKLVAVGIGLVGVGAFAERMVGPHLLERPELFLVPGLLWIGSYVLYSVGAAIIVFKQWDGRRDRAFLVDGLLMLVAIMVPTVELVVRPAVELTPGPAIFRVFTGAFMALDGITTFSFAHMALNGRRRHPSLWFYIVGTGAVVAFEFGTVLLRASVETKYVAGGWIVAWIFVALAALHPRMPELTEPNPEKEVRLDGFRITILALALMSIPMTLVLRVAQGGTVSVAAMLAASALVAVLVLLRLTWLFGDKEKAQHEIESRERHFRALVRNIGDAISVVDSQGRVRYTSPSTERMLGYSVDEVVGTDGFVFVDGLDAEKAHELFGTVLAEPGALARAELRARHRDGSTRWLDVTVHNLLHDPDVGNVVVACHDVTERRQLEEQLRHDAYHDSLTGLPNRASAVEQLERLLRRAAVGGRQLGVVFADLDRFKEVNDTLGHAAGDELLRGFARRLSASVRPTDTVARLGGDEFLLLIDAAGRADVEAVARRVVRAMAEPFVLEGREVRTTTSMGIAVGGMDAVGDELLRDADLALYRAKAAGRNAYAVFDPELDDRPAPSSR